MKVICTRCGGTNIACEAIVNPNTGKIIDYLDESFMHANCGDCKEEVVITDVDRVKKDIDSMFFEFVKKNGKEPEYAECQIVWKDTGDDQRTTIKLSLSINGRWTQAAEELVSSCGLTEDECRELQEESGSFNDEMLDFINSVFGHEDMINNSITLENIGYHKIGSIFKYNIGSKEVELEVVESSDASCEGCVFNNSKNYYCKDTHCIDVDRKDDIDVIYKEVKRS